MKTFLSSILPVPARRIALSAIVPLGALLFSGCDLGSADSTSAILANDAGQQYNFSGLYVRAPQDGDQGLPPLVYPADKGNRPSGKLITSLRLLQYGKVLEAYDSASMTWAGSISSLDGDTASFTLRGRTTAGMATEIAGTMVYADAKSTMNATWIEPNFYGNLFATATVSPAATNTQGQLKITPTTATLSASSPSKIFTASGGTDYTWSQANSSAGSFTPKQGATVTYTLGAAGEEDTLTVTSGGKSASAKIFCQ